MPLTANLRSGWKRLYRKWAPSGRTRSRSLPSPPRRSAGKKVSRWKGTGAITKCRCEEQGDGHTGSRPASSKASYRYPRKKTSSGRANQQQVVAAIPRQGKRPRDPEIAGGRGSRTNRKKAIAPRPASRREDANALRGPSRRAHPGKPLRQYRGRGA